MCDIIFDQSARRGCRVSMLNKPNFTDLRLKYLRIFLGNLRKTLKIFGKNRKNVRNHS